MRRTLLLALPAGLIALAAGVPFLSGRSTAGGDPPGPARAGSATLALTRAWLYSSGVGHFHREATVEGTARVDLSFPVSDINDILKSLVWHDADGGYVRAVGYDSPDPVEKTLRGYAINLTGNPSYAGVLHQARGEKVEVTLTG